MPKCKIKTKKQPTSLFLPSKSQQVLTWTSLSWVLTRTWWGVLLPNCCTCVSCSVSASTKSAWKISCTGNQPKPRMLIVLIESMNRQTSVKWFEGFQLWGCHLATSCPFERKLTYNHVYNRRRFSETLEHSIIYAYPLISNVHLYHKYTYRQYVVLSSSLN